MSELLDGTGHPRHFGFFQCARCGTHPLRHPHDTQAGKATGLDANGDAT